MSIYIHKDTGVHIVDNIISYYQMSYDNIIDLLFYNISNCKITDNYNKSNICIYGIQTTSNTIINNNKDKVEDGCYW